MQMRRALALGFLLATPCVAHAQSAGSAPGPYISLGIGPDFFQTQTLKPQGGSEAQPHRYSFDPGFSVSLGLGYGLGGGLRLELQGDYQDSHVASASGSVPLRAGGYETHYGGFVNAYQDFARPFALPLTPYVGLGAGYQQLALNNVNASGPGAAPESGPSQSQGSFAYQGIAGVSAGLGVPGLDVTAEYRLTAMVTPPGFARTDGEEAPIRATVNNTFSHQLMIGLRLLFGGPRAATAATSAAPPSAVPAPQPARTYLVFFDWNAADLSDRARAVVAEAASASRRVETTRIDVEGHTDASGTPQYNQALSTRRADAVAEELVRDGVSRGIISITAYGSTRPLVPTAPGVREPQNRRVEIVLD